MSEFKVGPNKEMLMHITHKDYYLLILYIHLFTLCPKQYYL
jgi:hypothetical protein